MAIHAGYANFANLPSTYMQLMKSTIDENDLETLNSSIDFVSFPIVTLSFGFIASETQILENYVELLENYEYSISRE